VKRLFSLAILLLAANSVGARAATAPQYDRQPPGQIVQDVTAYLSGEGMNSAWHVVTSRTLAGKDMGKTPVYQWYLSFYAPAQNGLKLVYRLPNASGFVVPKVTKAHGAQMYYPMSQLKIVGTAELEQSGVQDVVVQSSAAAADCGLATVAVFGSKNASGAPTVEPRVAITNACALKASIVKSGSLQAVQLNGPYYSAKAALCCPTKPNATAKLSYAAGKWNVSPQYFMISASMASHM
jgi:hypothetical protein